jgi:biotin transport system substrate-specific component
MQSALQSSVSPASAQGQKSFENSLPAKIALCIAATGLVAICAHISFPLPFTAVPLTMQTFAVILLGMVLGPVAGFSAMVLYLAEGAIGLPVFSPHGLGLHGPTAGFLFSYPLAAAAAGYFTRSLRLSTSNFRNGIIGGIAASLPIFALGAVWLAVTLHLNGAATWSLGVAPFLPGEVIKVTAAASIFSTLQRLRRDRR